MSFSNKVVLVTGGSSGIGASTAILFSQQGASVAIVGRNETKLQDVASKCNAPLVILADVTKEEDAKRIVKITVEKFDRIDILVNNAGIIRPSSIEDQDVLAKYDEVVATNVRAVVNLTNLTVPYLIQSKGNIVNISSAAGEKVIPSFMVYAMSKAAINHFTRHVALELAAKGVRVNAVSPGPVRTDVFKNANVDIPWEVYGEMTALRRVGDPHEIAELVLFLASDKAKSITGANYVADNGFMMK